MISVASRRWSSDSFGGHGRGGNGGLVVGGAVSVAGRGLSLRGWRRKKVAGSGEGRNAAGYGVGGAEGNGLVAGSNLKPMESAKIQRYRNHSTPITLQVAGNPPPPPTLSNQRE